MGVSSQTLSGVTTGNIASDSANNPHPVAGMSGVGAHTAIPTSGTASAPVALGSVPAGAVGVRLYAPAGVSFPFCVAASASAAATAFAAGAFKTFSQSTDGPNWDENLNGMNVYVGPITGNPATPSATAPVASFRYI